MLTNNQAEYHAVLAGMRLVTQLSPTKIEFRLDSELTVRQLSGEWKIKNAELRSLAKQVHDAVPPNVNLHFIHIDRASNAQADKLANWALDHTSPDAADFKS